MIFDQINLDEEEYNIIPINWGATKYYNINLEGWPKLTVSHEDEIFNKILPFAVNIIHSFINLYKETHAFSQPHFIWNMNGSFSIKIGTLPLEEYLERMDKLIEKV
jgi:hypothetical protein